MANDPKTDLIYAILAMDSYNRGYGSGISNLGNSGFLGNWELLPDSENRPSILGGFNAGFYAIAYKKSTETVISYRGTDFNGELSFSPLSSQYKGGSDATNGYGIALGATQGSAFDFATEQAKLSVDFYRAVTGKSDTQSAANVTLTGHSLGGGLAGYVGLTSGTQSVLFDHLPFDVSGLVRASALGVTAQFDKTRGYFTQGEFLQAARSGDLQTALGGVIGGIAALTLGPVVGGVVAAYGGSLGGATAALEANIEKTELR